MQANSRRLESPFQMGLHLVNFLKPLSPQLNMSSKVISFHARRLIHFSPFRSIFRGFDVVQCSNGVQTSAFKFAVLDDNILMSIFDRCCDMLFSKWKGKHWIQTMSRQPLMLLGGGIMLIQRTLLHGKFWNSLPWPLCRQVVANCRVPAGLL